MHLLHRLPAHRRRIAVVAGGRSYRYGELLDTAECIAGALVQRHGGVPLAEARIAFREPPGLGYVATLLGIWNASGVAVPLAVSHPRAELEHTLRDSGASRVIAASDDDDLRTLAAELDLPVSTWEELAAAPPVAGLQRPSGAARAMILYTSGSTGRPKGVVHTHDSLAAQMASLVEAWRWTSEDRILNVLPLHHVHGVINVLGCALWAGACWETLPAFDATAVWRAFYRHRPPTLFMAVPTVYRRLLDHQATRSQVERSRATRAAARLRLMVSGSAALPIPLLEAWREATGHTLLERYGMTEIGMALSNPLEGERRPGCVGNPLPGVEVRLVDEEGALVPEAEPGEIEVRGPAVFLEYWNRPAETTAAFDDGWFKTGDLAVVEDGAYRILGRLSVDIVKTGGYKVSALEVEAMLLHHPSIIECAVVGLPDDDWGERLHAVVVLRKGAIDIDLDFLRNWCRPLLAPYKIPRGLSLVDELPRNALGKVVKPELVRSLAAGAAPNPD